MTSVNQTVVQRACPGAGRAMLSARDGAAHFRFGMSARALRNPLRPALGGVGLKADEADGSGERSSAWLQRFSTG
jgi:hypothetical protein